MQFSVAVREDLERLRRAHAQATTEPLGVSLATIVQTDTNADGPSNETLSWVPAAVRAGVSQVSHYLWEATVTTKVSAATT
jgi:hypothetical protein